MYVRIMQAEAVRAAVTALRAAYQGLADCQIDTLTKTELVSVLDDLETLSCQLPSQSQRLLARLQTETTPKEMGAKSWKDVLRLRWRISPAEAARRLAEAAELGPRRSLTGERLDPLLPATATAAAQGALTPEHTKTVREAIADLPGFVDTLTRAQFEADLVRIGRGVGPRELKDAAAKALFLLDQDGPEPDDAERMRKRAVHAAPQGRDGMVAISGHLSPEAWAIWEVIFAKYAAPGMCNPDDPEPCTCGTPSQAQIDADHRSGAQRRHDAMVAIGRIALMSGQLGVLNGLPASIANVGVSRYLLFGLFSQVGPRLLCHNAVRAHRCGAVHGPSRAASPTLRAWQGAGLTSRGKAAATEPGGVRVDSKVGVLSDVCAALFSGDSGSARATLRSRYPFVPVEKIARRYSVSQSMKVFLRDGFIDCYTGNRLVNPGVLRLLHVVLGDDFPAHPNWKASETHPAFWDLFPTVDHVQPVSRGGRDDESNLVTASMLSNRAKDQWTLEDLRWKLHPAGSVEDWDGLSRWLINYLAKNPTVLQEAPEPHRSYIQRWLNATRTVLEAGG